jgi:hypothetical protein
MSTLGFRLKNKLRTLMRYDGFVYFRMSSLLTVQPVNFSASCVSNFCYLPKDISLIMQWALSLQRKILFLLFFHVQTSPELFHYLTPGYRFIYASYNRLFSPITGEISNKFLPKIFTDRLD